MTADRHVWERVTTSALERRVRRRLAKQRLALVRPRSGCWKGWFGPWFVTDQARNSIIEHSFELEPFARRIGVLKDFEFWEGAA